MIKIKDKIIAGFPAIGKSYYAKNSQLKISDSDSSKFSWLKEGVRNPDFPKNYIDYICSVKDDFDYVLVSTHKEVREALVENKIIFVIVYPSITSKSVYLQRFQERGNPQSFIDLVNKNWVEWINDCKNQVGCGSVELTATMFLSDILL